jgi:hypothetical protein
MLFKRAPLAFENGRQPCRRPAYLFQNRQLIQCLLRSVGSLHLPARTLINMIHHSGDAIVFSRWSWRSTGGKHVM